MNVEYITGGADEPENPTISVVIPVYNAQEHIGQALASVVAQTLPPQEIIVVDDGSTDNTGAVISEFAQTVSIPIRLLRQANQGPAVARNKGIDAARGNFIAFLDADDVWLPEKLREQVALLQAQPQVAFVLCHVQVVLAPGVEWPVHLNRAYYETEPPLYAPSALLARRELFKMNGGFDPAYRVGEDTDWFFRARELGVQRRGVQRRGVQRRGVQRRGVQRAVVPQVLVRKLIHGANISLQIEDGKRNMFQLLRDSVKRRRTEQGDDGESRPDDSSQPQSQSHSQSQPQPVVDSKNQTSTDTNPLAPVSVIIPVYNGARYLGEAVRSILAQTPAPQAIFVVDDGSTDETRAVVEQLIAESSTHPAHTPQIRYIYQTNQGAGAATNRGIEAAGTEFLAFLDADDLWERAKLSRQLAALREDPILDAVFGYMRQFYSTDREAELRQSLRYGEEVVAGYHVGSLLIRRSVFHQTGLFDPGLKAYFIDGFVRAQAAGLRYRLLDDVVVLRRIHGDNLTVRARDDVQSDYFRILKANLDRRRSAKS